MPDSGLIDSTEERTVAKSTGHGGRRDGAGRPRSERRDIAVKMDRALVAKARFVAQCRGLTLAEYVTESLRPTVDKDFAKESRAPLPRKPKGDTSQ